jgi:lipocalin
LSSYRYSYKSGLLLMEAKKEYKKRLGKSPDRADSWILTHAPWPKGDAYDFTQSAAAGARL